MHVECVVCWIVGRDTPARYFEEPECTLVHIVSLIISAPRGVVLSSVIMMRGFHNDR